MGGMVDGGRGRVYAMSPDQLFFAIKSVFFCRQNDLNIIFIQYFI